MVPLTFSVSLSAAKKNAQAKLLKIIIGPLEISLAWTSEMLMNGKWIAAGKKC